ncbi:sterol desaturase family protein [Chitinimonas sp. BJB300]|nr:sterol desaturase family protein [Chitinimonas sp. BJB300]PHV12456.1 C4-dicarboxylate ABC transporter [Chitinimonas sp. BJB300]TSJ88553.1 sterol desaturase family protein [Chitinimonas sp. BJB300]
MQQATKDTENKRPGQLHFAVIGTRITNLLSGLAYPLLLVAAAVTLWATFRFDLNYGLCNVVFLAWTILYLAILEWLIPYDMTWRPTGREWARDGLYLLITMVGGGMAVAAVLAVAAFVSPRHSSWPLWLEIPLALGGSSFGSYVFHRAGHTFPWLWRIHGIHHVEAKVNVGNNGLNHVLDVFGRRFLAQLPLILLGLSQPAIFVVSIFNTLQGYFVHANIRVRLGKLNYLVVSPEQHRLHHSLDLQEAGHFSVDIPLWDWLFGSFTWQPGRVPKAIGIEHPDSFPPPNAIVASFLYPWRKRVYPPAPAPRPIEETQSESC